MFQILFQSSKLYSKRNYTLLGFNSGHPKFLHRGCPLFYIGNSPSKLWILQIKHFRGLIIVLRVNYTRFWPDLVIRSHALKLITRYIFLIFSLVAELVAWDKKIRSFQSPVKNFQFLKYIEIKSPSLLWSVSVFVARRLLILPFSWKKHIFLFRPDRARLLIKS